MINFTPTVSQLKMLASVRGNLWLIHEWSAVELALSALQLSERKPRESYWSDDELSDYYTVRQKSSIDSNGIARIEVRGAMLHECQPLYERVGLGIRYKTIMAETNAAVDQGAKGILYAVNSPGGTVSGNIEASELIAGLPIPTVAHCDGLACSAAYKVSAGTNQIVATKSALMGNIGTILSWSDLSEFWQRWGVNFKAITSEFADLKSTFHLEPNDAQLAFLQESVNEAGQNFRNHVKMGREAAGAELDPEIWRAGWYSGEHAADLGLIDEIGSEQDALDLLLSMI